MFLHIFIVSTFFYHILYSKMMANSLFFYVHVNKLPLPYFCLNIRLYFAHSNEVERAD